MSTPTPLPPHPQKSPEERKRLFYRRLFKSVLFTSFILFLSLGLGVLGYHELAHLSWIDSLLNASMILSGMGPASPLETTQAKLFASFYALYSGGAFLIAMAVILAPLLHHWFKNFEIS